MPLTAGDKLVCVCNFIMITMFVYNRICVLTKLWKFERRRPSAVIGCLRRCICLTSVVNAFRTGLSDGKQFVMVGGARQKIELNKPIAVGFTIRLAVIVIIKRRHTLAWKGILVSVVFFSMSGNRYLREGGTDRREILHDGTYRSRAAFLSFWWRCPNGSPKSEILGLNFGHLTANISKTVSRSATCQLELNISSTTAV